VPPTFQGLHTSSLMISISTYLHFVETGICNCLNLILTKAIINRSVFKYLNKRRFVNVVDCLVQGETGLDLGCGTGSDLPFRSLTWLGVDIHMPSIFELKSRGRYQSVLCANILDIDKVLRPKCVDTIVAFDLIEHFGKHESTQLLLSMEDLARRRIILFTPNGYLEQDPRVVIANPWMEHRAGWTVAELQGFGYNVIGWSGWRGFAGPRGYVWHRLRALFQILSLVSQPFVENRPPLAFHLLCWKDVAYQGL
jgi:hypothetical protein